MSMEGATSSDEGHNPHILHTAISAEDREKQKAKKTKKSAPTDTEVNTLGHELEGMHLDAQASDEEVDACLERVRELVRKHHETAEKLRKQGGQIARIDDKEDEVRHNVDDAREQVAEVDSGCLSFIKCLFPCCFSCCSKCCTHNHEHEHEMQNATDFPVRPDLVFAGPKQLKTRLDKIKEIARLIAYLKSESQLEGRELEAQNEELDQMHHRVVATTDVATNVDSKAKKIIKREL